jgi:hypothetical protein
MSKEKRLSRGFTAYGRKFDINVGRVVSRRRNSKRDSENCLQSSCNCQYNSFPSFFVCQKMRFGKARGRVRKTKKYGGNSERHYFLRREL